MKSVSLLSHLWFAAALIACTVAAQQLPEPLILQIKHLAKAYGDAYAMEDVEGRMIQRLSPGPDGERVLTVFGVKGFRSGVRYRQYLAMFVESAAENDEKHYRLIDVMPIGRRTVPEVPGLDAKVTQGSRPGDLTIVLPALDNTKNADPNALRVMTMIHLQLKDGRLIEVEKSPEASRSSTKEKPAPSKR